MPLGGSMLGTVCSSGYEAWLKYTYHAYIYSDNQIYGGVAFTVYIYRTLSLMEVCHVLLYFSQCIAHICASYSSLKIGCIPCEYLLLLLIHHLSYPYNSISSSTWLHLSSTFEKSFLNIKL